jgi:hypothetical protein
MALRRLSLTRGDSRTLPLAFTDKDGLPVCLKNWTVFFTLKTHWALPDSQASLQKIVTTFSDTTSGTSGSASIVFVPADTESLEPMEYDFDIAVCTNEGLQYTVLKGKFDLGYDVTQTAGTAGTAA